MPFEVVEGTDEKEEEEETGLEIEYRLSAAVETVSERELEASIALHPFVFLVALLLSLCFPKLTETG